MRELGIRIALGATAGSVQWMLVRQGLTFGLAAIVIGSLVSFQVSRVVERLIYGITTRDPLTFGVVALVLALVAVAASYVPARRATRIDPIETLRAG
jgi:ABC-type antimicrobial peptide transport system permease subunit